MKNTLKALALVVVLALSLAPSAFAQTATTQTVLSAAITSPSATNITVASTTGITASSQTTNSACWTDGEFMRVTAVNTTSGNLTVTRGYQTTRATTHATASVIWCGIMGGSAGGIGYPFTNSSPVPGSVCTSTQFGNLPIINYQTGDWSNCLTSARGGQWVTYNYKLWASGHPIVNIPDTAYTITLADEFVIYSNITTGRTATLPAITGLAGKTVIVKNNGTPGSSITVAAPSGQFIGTGTTSTVTVTNSLSVNLLSIQAQSGKWGWITTN